MSRTTKTLRKAAAILFTLALLLPAGALPAWAEDPPPINSAGTPENPAQVVIAKSFKTPESTPIPDASFEFEITKVSLGDVSTEAEKDKMPDLSVAPVSISADDLTSTAVFKKTEDGVTTIIKETGNLLNGVEFDDPGVYTYNVREKQNNEITGGYYEGITGSTLKTHESEAEYEVSIFVYPDPNDNSKFYAAYVTAWLAKDNAGETQSPDSDDKNSGKVGPSPIYPIDPDNLPDEDDFGMTFTNSYAVTNSTDFDEPTGADDPDIVLSILNEIDDEDLNKEGEFPFDVRVDFPELGEGFDYDERHKRAYVVDESGPVTGKSGFVSGENYYEFESGKDERITLKGGETLVFTAAPVGTTWEATEILSGTDFDTYTPSVEIWNGAAVRRDVRYGVKGVNLLSGTWLLNEDTLTLTNTADKAEFFSDINETPPTGLIVNNLPYLGLILFSLAALAAYVAIGVRRRRAGIEENA
jgi:hypothetical protein